MAIWPTFIYFYILIVMVKKINYLPIFVLTEQPNGHYISVLCNIWPEAKQIFEQQSYTSTI
jgi:hypothetical protein